MTAFGLKGIKLLPQATIIDTVYSAQEALPRHIDYKNRISIVLRGKLKELACGKEVFATTGNLVFKPGDMPHTNAFGGKGNRIISVEFEEGFLEQSIDVSISDWLWFCHPGFTSTSFSFAQNLTKVSSENDLLEAILELFAAVSAQNVLGRRVPSWMKLVEEKIHDDFTTPIQSKSLAEMVGVHPVYLARAFRRVHHCSVKNYLQRIRLHRSIQDLSNSQKTLSHIALDAGFSDQSHFNRIFKQNIQLSPGIFRKWVHDF